MKKIYVLCLGLLTFGCGGNQSGGPEGSACDPASQTYGCHLANRMVCLSGSWHVEEECPSGWRCKENRVELPNGTVLVESTECYGTTPPNTGNPGASLGENVAAFCDKGDDCCDFGPGDYVDCLEDITDLLDGNSSANCEERFGAMVSCSLELSCSDFCGQNLPEECRSELMAFGNACQSESGAPSVSPPPPPSTPVDPAPDEKEEPGEDTDTEPPSDSGSGSDPDPDSGSGGDSD